MPTYEYACPKCGIVEAFQSIKEPALTKCPSCKKAKVHRMISLGGGVIFKGSGFWETDYNRSSDYQKKSKSESSTAVAEAPAATATESPTKATAATAKVAAPMPTASAETPKKRKPSA